MRHALTSHDAPDHPAAQKHWPRTHVPWLPQPPAQLGVRQSTPSQPGWHVHCGALGDAGSSERVEAVEAVAEAAAAAVAAAVVVAVAAAALAPPTNRTATVSDAGSCTTRKC